MAAAAAAADETAADVADDVDDDVWGCGAVIEADTAAASVSSSNVLLVVLPTSATSSPLPNILRGMANGSSKCSPGFTFNLGCGTAAGGTAAAVADKSNDGIAIRLENFAAFRESSDDGPLVLAPRCLAAVKLPPTRSGCSKLFNALQVTRGLALLCCIWFSCS